MRVTFVVTMVVNGSAVTVALSVEHLCSVRNYRAARKTKLNRYRKVV